MDFLKKAKAQLAEVQGDLSKATASLGFGDKKEESAPAGSTSSTPMDTPAPSVAPSTAGAPKAKLPLAIRKNLRDKWESAQPELEKKISDLLGVTWKIDIDVPYIYTFADSNYSKDNPGNMIKSYIEGAFDTLQRYVDNYGDDGKSEINSVVSSHTITMDVTSKEGINYTACEIVNGVLRILFVKSELGTNVRDSLENLSDAINQAGSSGEDALDFNARSSIKSDYGPKIDAVKAKYQKMLNLSTFDIEPNFEHNYAKMLAYRKKNKAAMNAFPREWQKSLGRFTLDYFNDFGEVMENKSFGNDEMLQEGFNEAVEKNQIALRVVDTLSKGKGYNECVIENGVLYIQTTAEFWATSVGDPAHGLIDIL